MTKDNNNFNLCILAAVAIPYVFIPINILSPFVGFDYLGSSFPEPEFSNHHIFGWWILIFVAAYPILYLFKEDKDIFITSKLAVCGSSVIALMDPFSQTYGLPYFIVFLILTSGAMYGLYWKPSIKRKTDYGKFYLLLDPKGKMGIPTHCLHENVQIVGGTGTGKTHFVIKPFIEQTIQQGLGCFIYDVKGNMLKDVAFYAREAKYRYIYHFNLANPARSHSYNPLYGDNADAIANRVFTALYYDTRNTERYYVELAEGFLHNLIGLLKKEIKTITFQDLLTATQEADTFKTIGELCSKYPETSYAWYFQGQWLGKSPKERRADLSGLVNKLQRFCNSEWSFLLNVKKPDVRMEEIVKRGEIFLFSPDAARYPEDAKALSILAMMNISEQLSDRYHETPEKPFRVFLDEFYNLAYPRFIDFINKCREAKIELYLAHQSLGDLKGISPEFFEQVMNTASNKIILRVNDPNTAEEFARQFGTEEDRDYKVESFGADGRSVGYSKPQVEKFRFHPNRIKELKAGHAIVKVTGYQAFHTPLRFATKAPEDFNPQNNVASRQYREDRVNESSINGMDEKKVKQPVKLGSRMGEVDHD